MFKLIKLLIMSATQVLGVIVMMNGVLLDGDATTLMHDYQPFKNAFRILKHQEKFISIHKNKKYQTKYINYTFQNITPFYPIKL